MRMRWGMAAAALLFVWGYAPPVYAQKNSKPPKPPPAPRVNINKGAGKNPKNDPVKELERFQKMSPEEREKELAKLPPQRRERVERQMERLDNMSPEQRARMLNRLQTMQHLSPERKQAVTDEIQYLRGLPPNFRRARLYGSEFEKQYSPEEQKVIRETFPGMKPFVKQEK